MNAEGKTPWTTKLEIELGLLWPNHSASAISNMPRFEEMSKNAIIGKVNRMGLPAKPRPPQRVRQKGTPNRPKGTHRPLSAPFIAFEDVGKGCRYPHNDADPQMGGKMLVCGFETLEELPYCSEHQKQATMIRKRRRK